MLNVTELIGFGAGGSDWSIPVSIANFSSTTNGQTAVTFTGVTASVGDFLFFVLAMSADNQAIAVTDSVGNTWSDLGPFRSTTPAPDHMVSVGICHVTTALSGGTVTLTKNGGTPTFDSAVGEMWLVKGSKGVSNATISDSATTNEATSAGTASLSVSSLGAPAESDELFVAGGVTNSTSATYTEDTANGWTTLQASRTVATPNMRIFVAYKIAPKASQTHAPTHDNVACGAFIVSFKKAA